MLNAASLTVRMGMLPDQQTLQVNFKNRTTTVSVNVAGCTRRPVDADAIEFANSAGFGLPTSTFMLPVANMGGNVLKQEDQIIENSGNGTKWNVIGSRLELQGTIYRAYVNQV